jgi:hypothetical protein
MKNIQKLNFEYYILPPGMEQVYGVDRNRNRFNSMAMENPIRKLKSIIKNIENFKEYTPKQDTFGDGWNECVKQLLKEIEL